jgi:hypothetical protein
MWILFLSYMFTIPFLTISQQLLFCLVTPSLFFVYQLHKIQTDCTVAVAAARKSVEVHEAACQEVANQMQKVDVELRLKSEEAQGMLQESNAKRQELSRLSSSRSALQQCQLEFENAQRTHDEFMATYQTKSAQYKKQIKVSTSC